MPQLVIPGFTLRPFTAADAPGFAAAVRESTATVGRWMPWAHAGYTSDEALARFAACDANRANGSAHEFGLFRPDGSTFIGGAGLNQFNLQNGFCNLGYWVRESAQRQGAALAAIGALSRFAFSELGFSRLEIVIADGNAASMAVARKAGATYECLAQNRLKLRGQALAAHVLCLLPA
ncbi:MAG: GNAT family N-acetyltransferase [Pseudomonadota bacterium]